MPARSSRSDGSCRRRRRRRARRVRDQPATAVDDMADDGRVSEGGSAEDRGQGCHGHVGDGDAICGVGGSGDSSDLDRRGLSVGARAPPDQAVSQRALRDRHRVVSVAVALDRRERRAGGERGWIVEHLDESALDRVVALEVYDGACHGDRAGGDRVDEVRAEAGVVGRLARRIGLIVRAEVRDTSSPKTRTGRSARSRATHSPRPPTVVDAFAFSLSSPSFRLASPSLRPRPRLAHLRLALTFAPATPSPSPSSSRSSPSGCYRCRQPTSTSGKPWFSWRDAAWVDRLVSTK